MTICWGFRYARGEELPGALEGPFKGALVPVQRSVIHVGSSIESFGNDRAFREAQLESGPWYITKDGQYSPTRDTPSDKEVPTLKEALLLTTKGVLW